MDATVHCRFSPDWRTFATGPDLAKMPLVAAPGRGGRRVSVRARPLIRKIAIAAACALALVVAALGTTAGPAERPVTQYEAGGRGPGFGWD